MEEERVNGETLEAEGGVETPETPQVDLEAIEAEKQKLAELVENYRVRAEKAEKALKSKPLQTASSFENQVEAIDLIKVGKKLQNYSDEELDFVTEHAKSKKPEDILKALENPFIQAGIEAHRVKTEKERQALNPTGTQPESDKPRSLSEQLRNASTLKEKEDLLRKMGLYQDPKRRTDTVQISRKI